MATWTELPRPMIAAIGGEIPSKWEVQISYDHERFPGCYGFTEHDDKGEGGGLWFTLNAENKWELTDYDGMTDLPRSIVKTLKNADFSVPEDF